METNDFYAVQMATLYCLEKIQRLECVVDARLRKLEKTLHDCCKQDDW